MKFQAERIQMMQSIRNEHETCCSPAVAVFFIYLIYPHNNLVEICYVDVAKFLPGRVRVLYYRQEKN